ncbi:hypothetical protein Hanom_Chr10g00940161 [Helianthus anomalus]
MKTDIPIHIPSFLPTCQLNHKICIFIQLYSYNNIKVLTIMEQFLIPLHGKIKQVS